MAVWLVGVIFSSLPSVRWEHLVYQFGCHGNTIKYVIKEGNVVVENKTD